MRSSCLFLVGAAWLVFTVAACAAPKADGGAPAADAQAGGQADTPAGEAGASVDAAAEVSATAEYIATEADFDCIKNGTKVGHFYVANRLGKQDAAAAVAKGNAKGAVYPVGTIIRLFPLEAMVKRGGSAFAATGGWEMFRLKFNANNKTEIAARGGAEVGNAAGSCVGCHSPAKEFDYVCGGDHGCAPIPVSAEAAQALQDADPSCP